MRKTVVISKEKIAENVALAKKLAGKSEIYAVLKSNAYGHGLEKFAFEMRANGIHRFAVTEPRDALKLRAAGFLDEEILVMRSTASENDINDILKATATATIGSYDDAVLLNSIAGEKGITCDAHIKIDTGLGRYGFDINEIDRVISIFRFMENINITGMFSHYSHQQKKKKCIAQYDTFQQAVAKVRDAGFDPGMLHIDSSVSLVKKYREPLDAVRCANALLGTTPIVRSAGFKQVATVQSEVCEIRWLSKGHSIGYNGAFVTKRPMKIAYIPVGYHDGFLVGKQNDVFSFRAKAGRAYHALLAIFLPQKAYVLIDGKKAKVLGHLGMNHAAVDISEIPDCAVGTKVTLPCTPFYIHTDIPRDYV